MNKKLPFETDRKVNIFDYYDMLDYTEERFEILFEKYPKDKDLLLDLRNILRFYQLCMNLILGKADATQIVLKEIGSQLKNKGLIELRDMD